MMDNQNVENCILSDAALENVSGGTSLGVCFPNKMEPGQCVIGMEYYVVCGHDWYSGRLEEIIPSGSPDEWTFTFRTDTCNGLKKEKILKVSPCTAEIYAGAAAGL